MPRGRHQGIQGFTGRPLDLDERITLKLGELTKLHRLAEQFPNDTIYPVAIRRARSELQTLRNLNRKER